MPPAVPIHPSIRGIDILLCGRVIPEIGEAVYQEQGEVLIGAVVFWQLIDVVVFSTSAQSDRVVVE